MGASLQLVSEIAAPRERVWEALTDLGAWDTWNPTLTRPRGELREKSVVRMRLKMGRLSLPMRQEIVEVSPPSVLRWRSGFGPRWLLSVLRTFLLEPAGEGRSRLAQSEVGTGALARLVFVFTARPTERGYAALADALNRRVGDGAA